MTDLSVDPHTHRSGPLGGPPALASVTDYVNLLKPRVMSLVIFTGLAGLVAAPGEIHPIVALAAIICLSVGAGAAGALNMWYDADIDAVMARTSKRPLALGKIDPNEALTLGAVLGGGSVLAMAVLVNYLSAALLALTIAFYLFVYTMWLKRRTPQNIVIGGAAGAFPPLIGWAAVTGTVTLEPLVLFAIIFFWTPPHFWALSLYRMDDYAKVGVPMMPVVAGKAETRRQMLAYAVITFVVSLLPVPMGFGGLLYGTVAAITGLIFVALTARVLVIGDGARADGKDADQACKQLFAYSILYLLLVFAALLIEHMG